MKKLLTIVMFLVMLSAQAQKLPHNRVMTDLYDLVEFIKAYNPALDNYADFFDGQAEQLISQIPADSLTMLALFKYVSQVCALANEGHFVLGSWSDTVHAGFLANRYHYMPLSVKVVQGKLYVWADVSDEQALQQGEEILSINNTKTKAIFEAIYKAHPADGIITTYVDRKIEQGFSWLYYFYVEQPNAFELRVKDSTGSVRKVTIKALTRELQLSNVNKYYPDTKKGNGNAPDAFYTLTYEGNAAYLTLPSFDYRQIDKYNIKSKKLYKAIFNELRARQVQHLVVDLRNNTGGRNELADHAVPYLLKPGKDAIYLRQTIAWNGKRKTYKLPRRSKLAFEGTVYVLVNGLTYSNGHMLARFMKEYADAICIGEETGTRYAGFAAGSVQTVSLINSNLTIGIPRYHYVFPPAEKQTAYDRGLLPRHTVVPTIEALMQKRDLPMEKAKALIQAANANAQ